MQQLPRAAAAAAAAQRTSFAQDLLSLYYRLRDQQGTHPEPAAHAGGNTELRTPQENSPLPPSGRAANSCCWWPGGFLCVEETNLRKFPADTAADSVQNELNAHLQNKQVVLGKPSSDLSLPPFIAAEMNVSCRNCAGRASLQNCYYYYFTQNFLSQEIPGREKKMLFFTANQGRTRCSHTKQTKHVRICQRAALLDDSRLKFTLAHLK